MKNTQKIYLIGLGAIGCAILKQTKDEGHNISVICDEKRKQRYISNSFFINNEKYDFDYVSESKNHNIDILLVSVKSNQLESAINDLQPFISKDTIIISLLNGINSERIIEKELNHKNVLHAYTIAMDSKKYGNIVEYTNKGKIVIGTPYNERKAILKKATNSLSLLGLNIEISENMLRDVWWKFMLNIGINQISALHKIPFGQFQNENIKKITKMAMLEAVNVANVLNINLTQEDINIVFEKSAEWGKMSKSSMLQDIENQRHTEIEALSGELCRLGKLHKIPTPINEFLLHSIRYIENSYE